MKAKTPRARPLLWPAFYTAEMEALGPQLHFIRRDELNDPRPTYTKQGLHEIAGHMTGFAGELAATVLRELASNADALAALNHGQDTHDGGFLGLNRAVHFHARRQLLPKAKSKTLHADVAIAWAPVGSAQVKDDCTKHGAAARQLVEGIVDEAMRVLPDVYGTCEDVLRAIDADMAHRATQTAPMRRRAKAPKKKRIRI